MELHTRGIARSNRPTRRWIRGLAALSVCALTLFGVAGSAIVATAGPASATNTRGPGLGTGTPHQAPSGAFILSPVSGAPAGDTSMLGVCIDHGAATPDTPAIATDVWTLGTLPADGDEATLGWMLMHWGDTGAFGYTANTFDAGISRIAQQTFDGGYTTTITATSVSAIRTFFTDYPGPWSIAVSLGTAPYTTGVAHSAAAAILASNGAAVQVAGLVIDLSGPTVPSSVTTPSTGVATFTYTTHSSATFTVTASSADLPSSVPYNLTAPSASGGQNLLAGLADTSASSSATGHTATPAPPPATPKATLIVKKTDATGGSALSGAIFTITGPSYPNGTTFTIPSTGERDFRGITLGTYTVTEDDPPPGWGMATPKTQSTDLTSTGQVVTFTFADPTTPSTISTAMAQQSTSFKDHVTVSGLPTNPALNGGAADSTDLNWQVLGPVAPVSGSCAGADFNGAPTFTSGLTVFIGNSSFTVDPAAAPVEAGCYGFASQVPANAYTSGATSPPSSSGEQDYVAPAMTTASSTPHLVAAKGGVVPSDTVTVTRITGAASKIAGTLVGPVPVRVGSTANHLRSCPTVAETATGWKKAPTQGTASIAVSKAGTYKLNDGTRVAKAGCYSWSDTLSSTATPPLYQSITVPAGTAAEGSYVAPAITTTAGQSTAAVGGTTSPTTLTDTVTITGTTAEPSEIAWSVSGPVAPLATGACPTGPSSYAGATVQASGRVAEDTSGTYKIADKTPVAAAGCYSWSDTLSSTTTPPAYTSVTVPAGTAAETSYLAASITTTAKQSATSVVSSPTAHTTISDVVTVTGTAGQPSKVAWSVLGPLAPVDGVCPTGGAAWGGAATQAKGTATVPAGTGPSATLTVKDPTPVTGAGCYRWTETLSSTATPPAYSPVVAPVGTAAEISYLAPSVTTTAKQSATTVTVKATAPTTLSDTVTVTGTAGEPSKLIWSVLGPTAGTLNGCQTGAPAWSSAATQAKGAVTVPAYTTASTTLTVKDPTPVTVAGCYSWTETLSSTATPPAYATVTVAVGTKAEESDLAPSVTTKANQSAKTVTVKATAPTTLTDTATVTGTSGEPAKVAWSVLGPVANVTGACPAGAAAWKNAAIQAKGAVTVPAYITASSTVAVKDPIPVTVAGCYSWTDTLESGEATPAFTSVSSPVGQGVEGSFVTFVATTSASSARVTGAYAATDTVTIWGVGTEGAKVTDAMLGPVAEAATHSCNGVSFAGATTVATKTVTVPAPNKPGTSVVVTIPGFPLGTHDGCFAFAATIAMTGVGTTVQPVGVSAELISFNTGSATKHHGTNHGRIPAGPPGTGGQPSLRSSLIGSWVFRGEMIALILAAGALILTFIRRRRSTWKHAATS